MMAIEVNESVYGFYHTFHVFTILLVEESVFRVAARTAHKTIGLRNIQSDISL